MDTYGNDFDHYVLKGNHMKTELLNEYIFTEIVLEIAQAMRRNRQQQMELEGASQEEIAKTPITIEDRRKALALLESERQHVMTLLEELHSDFSEYSDGCH
ncbi:hypothetical protein [Syntrophus sp. (in: bacteria)]|uniref:hypothetical protein n=2 Tax=Syntrophus TaxID=43773 RepID=UPI00345E320E